MIKYIKSVKRKNKTKLFLAEGRGSQYHKAHAIYFFQGREENEGERERMRMVKLIPVKM